MHDLELPDHEDSELALTQIAEQVAVPDTEATAELGEGQGDAGKGVFRGAFTDKDPKKVIDNVRKYEQYIQEAAKRFGVKVAHLRAIMAQESGGNPNADANPKRPVASAAGLMQVTGDTWKQMQATHRDLKQYDFQTYKYNPRINCLFGAATLASKQGILVSAGMSKDSPHFAELMVAAYNGGEGVVKAAIAHARAAGSKDPEGDALKEAHLVPAIAKFPSVYNYYLTGGGKKNNKSGTADEAVRLKFREISKYPIGVAKFMGAQRELGLTDAGASQAQKPDAETPSEAKAETPSEPKAETPSEAKAETPSEPKAETPSEAKAETPSEPKAETPGPRKGDRYPYQPEKYLSASLSGSVGKGGDNRKNDVVAVQNRLRFSAIDTGPIDGELGPLTSKAIEQFQRYFLREPDGLIEPGKRTARELFSGRTEVVSAEVGATSPREEEPAQRNEPKGAATKAEATKEPAETTSPRQTDEVSGKGAAQAQRLVATAAQAAGGRRPAGSCYAAVKRHIQNAGGYGNIRNIYTDARFTPQGEARNFAEVINSRGPSVFGLERLSVTNPYDAPEGALIVVSPGSPGTRHPTAGDITVRGPGEHFYNDGEMKYGGRAAWPAKTGRVLGVYRAK